uniref:UDP-glycosyltransferases domain-containing protein n=1 Tax=Anopheles epiroticus TaxID=199890 RepID=A0A182PLS9_9DIPT
MKCFTFLLVTVLTVLGYLPQCGQGAKILLVSAFPGMSHWLMFEHIIHELLRRGHELTAITSYRLRAEPTGTNISRYHEILIDPVYDFEANGLPMEVFYQSQSFGDPFFKMSILWKLGLETAEYAFESASVKKFLQTDGLTFDLLIAEQFVQESFLMFAHKYRVPIVTINTLAHADYIDRAFGLITPWSFVPHFMLQYDDRMSIVERAYNVFLSAWDAYNRKFHYLPEHTKLAVKYFGAPNTSGELPALEELERNVSVVLLNNHIISSRPRPRINGMIDIAGVHIRPARELPPVLKNFLDAASGGVIYINFGTFLKSSGMPPETLAVFLSVFRALPQYRFLWKWESETIPNLPPNVLLQRWIPQNDVLAHQNVKLFVSHGGIFGTQESIYWARPLLFVPFYGDQHSNALKFERAGIGLTLQIINVTVEDFRTKIERIVQEAAFQQNVNRLSALFRDNPTDPLEEAAFWIEYVVRHRGAAHLKSAAIEMPWYRYLLLDILSLTLLLAYGAVWMVTKLVRKGLELIKPCQKHFRTLSYIIGCAFAFTALCPPAEGGKILFLVPFPAPSHWLWIEHFVKELLSRGHEVTAITNFPAKEPHRNYTEVLIDPPYDIPYYFPVSDIYDSKYNSDLNNLFLYWRVGLSTTQYALENENVQQFIEQDDTDFDVIVSEQFYQEAFLMFAHKYRAPIVTLCTLGHANHIDQAMGLVTPWSFVPHPVLLLSDDMTFSQRCYNFLISLADLVIRQIYYIPQQNRLAQTHFARIEGPELMPSIRDLEKSISVILVNSHLSTSPPRPTIPGLVNVAGAHIKPAKELPDDIRKFLDGAKEGVIFFSLGSYMKSADMPKDKMKAFLEVFRNLKQRVLWKYENEDVARLPKNVMVRKWLPQSDILAHPKVVLFITHGGMFGSQEGIYRGVPMLYIPFYGDQHRNALKAEQAGYALTLNFPEVNVITLGSRINELLTNPTFMKQAKRASELFRDNLVPPMQEAMHWIEYVMRHKGAKHLKTRAIELSWTQYLLVDVVGFFLLGFLLLAAVFYKVLGLFLTPPKPKSKPKTRDMMLGMRKPKLN